MSARVTGVQGRFLIVTSEISQPDLLRQAADALELLETERQGDGQSPPTIVGTAYTNYFGEDEHGECPDLLVHELILSLEEA